MVFFRGPDGAIAAVEDFCPHRGAPLSMGRVVEGRLVCGYHGLEMGCDGKVIAMPNQRVRGFPAVKKYPAVERCGLVWVWPGDAEKADPAKIHHIPALGRQPRVGLWWRHVPREVRLPPDGRQPDGPDARDYVHANQPVDRWQICRFSPPSHVMIEVGVALAGKGGCDADPKDKAASTVVDFITPETETLM